MEGALLREVILVYVCVFVLCVCVTEKESEIEEFLKNLK